MAIKFEDKTAKPKPARDTVDRELAAGEPVASAKAAAPPAPVPAPVSAAPELPFAKPVRPDKKSRRK